jgi:hypothetical protein
MNIDVLVLGGSMPGLVTALECAKLGLKVAMVFTELELPEHPVTDADGGWAWLTHELELDAPVAVADATAFVRGTRGNISEVLPESLLGIPSSPLAAEVVASIGQSSATRAYLDRIRPVLTIGKERHLAALVTKRMGASVLTTLVEPFVRQRFGVDAEHVDVAIAAPGLNEAITRTGSLSTGVLATYAALNERMRTFELPAAEEFTAAALKRLEFWSVKVVSAEPAEFDLSTTELAYRTLVVAGGPMLADQIVGLSDLGLDSLAVRTSVQVAVESPIPVGFIGIGETSEGEKWAVTVRDDVDSSRATDGSRAIELLSPRSVRSLQASAVVETLDEATVNEILHTAGVEPSGMPAVRGAKMEYAPLLTVEEEHAHEGICQIISEFDAPKVVGDWLYQGDMSRAIIAAKAQATALRRQLLGLT